MDALAAGHALTMDRRETLLRIASLTADLNGIAAASADSNIDDEHDPEGSTVAFERAQVSALLSRAHSHLAEVELAQQRLSRSEYGRCERCRNPIADERLIALPAVATCIACANR